MSEPTATPRGAKEKRGIGKVLGKVKTVFHIRGSSSRKGAPSQPIVERPAVLPSPPPAPPARQVPHYEGATKMPRIQVHEDRMKKLGARFGIEIKPSEFHSSEGEVLRVDKPVRMRIHRQCHLCGSRIGVGNECSSCHHIRCRQCSRHPNKQTEAERQANRDKREALIQKNRDMAPILPSYDYSAPQIELKLPGKTEGSILVHKGRPRMRVRRYCHVCNTLITSRAQQARTCEKCGHRRCADCPRYPANKKSYPYGYPNDEPGPINKGVFACHECKAKFDPEAEDGTKCAECPHEKCPLCPRVRPRKIIPKPDASMLKSIQLRIAEIEGMQHDMAELQLSDD